jgi:hypothetical protein
MNTQTLRIGLWLCIAAFLSTAAALPAYAYSVDACSACHQDTTLTKQLPDGTETSLYVDRDEYLQSVHAQAGFTCVDCHEDAKPEEHPAAGLAQVECQSCHDDIAAVHAQSAHGQLLLDGNEQAPQCHDCHTPHTVLKSDNMLSSVHPDNLQATCSVCHPDESAPVICEAALEFAAGDTTALQRISTASALSIIATRLKGHGKTDFGCSYSTKRCSDCHFEVGAHGGLEKQPRVCAACHDMNRSSLLFGKIHKPSIFTGPMIILLLIMYVVCIGGLILFFRKKTKTADNSPVEPPTE